MAYVKIQQVASHLCVSRSTVKRLVGSKRIPCYHIGRNIRFRLDEIDKAIEKTREH